jgi:hypothetical protein
LILGGSKIYGNNACDDIYLRVTSYVVMGLGYLNMICFPFWILFICLENAPCLGVKDTNIAPDFEELSN